MEHIPVTPVPLTSVCNNLSEFRKFTDKLSRSKLSPTHFWGLARQCAVNGGRSELNLSIWVVRGFYFKLWYNVYKFLRLTDRETATVIVFLYIKEDGVPARFCIACDTVCGTMKLRTRRDSVAVRWGYLKEGPNLIQTHRERAKLLGIQSQETGPRIISAFTFNAWWWWSFGGELRHIIADNEVWRSVGWSQINGL